MYSGFRWVLQAGALIALCGAGSASAQQGALHGEWQSYGGDLGSTKYSPLAQIGPENVDRARVLWNWRSPDDLLAAEDPALSAGSFKATPIMADGVLFIRTSLSILVAIDAGTGEQIWAFDPQSYTGGRPTNLGFNSRGAAYWAEGDEKRVFLATGDSKLWAIDAETGLPITDFGDKGSINLLEGLGRPVPGDSYQVMSPPIVVRDLVIVGSSINDMPEQMTAPPGDVRAFDARTGEQRWVFRTIPQPGEFGHETWEDGGWEYTGNTNVWTMMSADEELGLLYLPVGTPTNDWYGGHRIGDNLFAESLVAVDVETGRRVWHFQTVHHGVWDYDLPAAPTLVDLNLDGERIEAVAQITKQGFVYLFDRATGEPVWPIVERPVPQSAIRGEVLSPTQPFPTRPPPFERQGVSEDELIDFTPALRAEAESIISQYEYGSLYHPPSLKGTINVPGWFGGANWYGGSVDPETGMLYIPSRTSAIVVQLVPGDPEHSDFRYVRGGVTSVAGPQGLPLFKPPHLRLTAIDLGRGEHAWQVPLGDGVRQQVIEMGVPDPGPLGGGGFTGPLLTKTLLFIGHSGARDGDPSAGGALLAFDKRTGEQLHATDLPANPTGTPMTYMLDGKQYIVVATSAGNEAGLVAVGLD